jgi:hypothetical protein
VTDIVEFREKPWSLKVCAVMSAPRLGFVDNFQSGLDSFNFLRIRLKIAQGAFWGQKLQAAMEEEIAAGYEVVITTDYDSIYNAMHVMAVLDGIAQGYDCVMPLQVKRHDHETMPFAHPDKGFTIGHFGLTAFRVEALARVPKPWFVETPDERGSWNGEHEDGDVYFWRRWAECGNGIGRLANVAIGHLESMVMWPGSRVQRAQAFFRDGAPAPWTLTLPKPEAA